MGMNPRLLRPTNSGFDPRRISGLSAWLDAGDPTSMWQNWDGVTETTAVTANADPVGSWRDKSGNGRHVRTSVANNRPTYRTSVVNGRSVLRFDGSNDELRGTADLPFPYSMFAVYQSSDAAAGIAGTIRPSGSFVAEGLRKSAASTLQGIQQNGTDTASVTTTASSDSWHIGEVIFSGTSSAHTYDLRLNGGAAVTMSTSRNRDTSAVSRIFLVGNTLSDFLLGDIAEILVYGKTVSDAERRAIERGLAAKYGIALT